MKFYYFRVINVKKLGLKTKTFADHKNSQKINLKASLSDPYNCYFIIELNRKLNWKRECDTCAKLSKASSFANIHLKSPKYLNLKWIFWDAEHEVECSYNYVNVYFLMNVYIFN